MVIAVDCLGCVGVVEFPCRDVCGSGRVFLATSTPFCLIGEQVMRKDIYRERALLRFRRYYMHGVRNDDDFEKASTAALWKAREETLAEIHDDTTFECNADREETWSQCMEVLALMKMILAETPIDKVKMEELRTKRLKEEASIKQELEGTSAIISNAIATGLEIITKEGS